MFIFTADNNKLIRGAKFSIKKTIGIKERRDVFPIVCSTCVKNKGVRYAIGGQNCGAVFFITCNRPERLFNC